MTVSMKAAQLIAFPNLTSLPKSSALRLYSPATQGNSFWMDGFPALTPGKDWLTRLVEIIEEWGIIGMTTNQTLFKQLLEGGVLDDRLRALKGEGRSPEQAYWILYGEAALQAAKVFSAVHAQWPWEGRVSQEASALLKEVDPLVRDVRRIARSMENVGAFTKIPNLPIGPQAIQKAVMGGTVSSGVVPMQVIHPNITLVFSDRHYIQTAEAYLLGLTGRVEKIKEQGFGEDTVCQDVSQIYSVNSLFVSRLDRVVDPMIEEAMQKTTGADRERLRLLKGKVAIAQAKKIHQMFEAIFLEAPFSDEEKIYADPEGMAILSTVWRLKELFNSLKVLGAHPQRLLIASSGVKSEQPYSPLLYVLPFLGAWSANTAPEGTLEQLSHFVENLSDQNIAALRLRNLMREPLPACACDVEPVSEWDRAVLMSKQERREQGVAELTAGQILREVQRLVFGPRGTSLREICESIRDKGAESFKKDEEATLQAIRLKLQGV